jgi:hypothetical protein
MDVRIDLYDDPVAGACSVETVARPEGAASPTDLPGRSADIILDGRVARESARSLLFWPAVSSPAGTGRLARTDGIVLSYLYHPKDEAESAISSRG